MASILDGELAEAIADALDEASIPQSITVTRTTVTDDPTPWAPGSGDETIEQVPHACKGWRDSYDAAYAAASGGSVLATDVKVIVLATTLDIEPTTSDTVTVGGSTWAIISVSRDAAGATWELQARV